jgi:hypothetical protein
MTPGSLIAEGDNNSEGIQMPFIMLDGTRNKIIEQGKYS